MMSQEHCLASPHHFTHLGVCYPGSVAYVGLSSVEHPQPATFSVKSVPEPATSALFALALLVLLFVRIKPRRGTKIG